LNDAELVE
jgi:hypothetical protein